MGNCTSYNRVSLAAQPASSEIFVLDFVNFFPSVERPLALPVFQAASMSDIVQIILLLPVSQSEAGREGCFDRTCKSILFSGKHRLIPQWLDS